MGRFTAKMTQMKAYTSVLNIIKLGQRVKKHIKMAQMKAYASVLNIIKLGQSDKKHIKMGSYCKK